MPIRTGMPVQIGHFTSAVYSGDNKIRLKDEPDAPALNVSQFVTFLIPHLILNQGLALDDAIGFVSIETLRRNRFRIFIFFLEDGNIRIIETERKKHAGDMSIEEISDIIAWHLERGTKH